MATTEVYLVTCWNCLGEFDALTAVWCSDDPKCPTKLCPFCLHCFCDANEKYKREFWRNAPPRLQEELQTLSKSHDRLGDILIRMKKITTPQLLDILVEQKRTGKKLGELLVEQQLVHPDDIAAALRTQGVNPLTDTHGMAYAATPVWDASSPEAIIQYILALAARKGASDVHIEPTEEAVAVKYRIDGFFFRVDPIPKRYQPGLTQKIFESFRLDWTKQARPQTSRTTIRIGETDYDVVAQTLPTAHGVSATFKLIDRATFLKDFSTLGLELEDQVRLVEELRGSFGLVLITAPVYNGANTTSYSVMSFLAQSHQRDLVALESPIHWRLEGARQVEVEADNTGLKMEEALRSVIAVRPEVIVLSALPDRGTALLAAQLASSILVVAAMSAQGVAQAVSALIAMGVPAQGLAGVLAVVTNQRLVRQICRICRAEAEPPAPQTLASLGISPEEASMLKFFRGRGCPTCNKVGYRGRRAIFEVMTGAPEIRAAIHAGLPPAELTAIAVGTGMRSVRDRCLDLVRQGITTFDEFVRLRL